MKRNDFWSKASRQVADPNSGPAPDPAPPEPAPVADPAPAYDLSFIPQDYQVDGKPDLGKFTEHYQELVSMKAQRDEAMASVPEAYDFAVPEDLKFEGLDLPDDFRMQIDTQDPELAPLFEQLGGTLKELGAPADAAGKMMGLLAQYQAIQIARDMKAAAAELTALGTPSQIEARMSTVTRALESRLPADRVAALQGTIKSAKALQALEVLVGPRGMLPPTPQPASADLENMTPGQRLSYANQQRGR
jgi:hypothetical protein